jgi:ABC-2 type transport system permease protein
MFAIYKKELKSYFYSPTAYVLLGLFMIIMSIFFYLFNIMSGRASLEWMQLNFFLAIIMMIFVSILTMRLISEDRKNKTDVMLITSPKNISSIVLGKYFAAATVYMVFVILTFIFPIILLMSKAVITTDWISGYVGFVLLGLAFISVGVFASALSESQVISAVISFIMLFLIWLLDILRGSFGGVVSKVMEWISLTARYIDFNRGILNINSIIYYITFTAVFLFLTIRIIEKRRWS